MTKRKESFVRIPNRAIFRTSLLDLLRIMNSHAKSYGGCSIWSRVEMNFSTPTQGSTKFDPKKTIFSASTKLSEGKKEISELSKLTQMQDFTLSFSMRVDTGSTRGNSIAKARGAEFFEVMKLKLNQVAATMKPPAAVKIQAPTPEDSDFILVTPTPEAKKMELRSRLPKKETSTNSDSLK